MYDLYYESLDAIFPAYVGDGGWIYKTGSRSYFSHSQRKKNCELFVIIIFSFLLKIMFFDAFIS